MAVTHLCLYLFAVLGWAVTHSDVAEKTTSTIWLTVLNIFGPIAGVAGAAVIIGDFYSDGHLSFASSAANWILGLSGVYAMVIRPFKTHIHPPSAAPKKATKAEVH